MKYHSLFALMACTAMAAQLLPSDAEARLLRDYKHKQQYNAPEWYVGLQGSVNFVSDADLDESGTPTPLLGDIAYEGGYGVGAVVGYAPQDPRSGLNFLRVEGELSLRDNELDSLNTSQANFQLNSDMQVKAAMLNLYADFGERVGWKPYIGAGVGAATYTLESTGTISVDDEDTVLAYQGMVGMNYTPKSMPLTEFNFGYKYFTSQDPEFISDFNTRLEVEYEAHTLEGGVRFFF